MNVPRTAAAGRKPCAAEVRRQPRPAAHRRIRGEDGWLHTIVPGPRKGEPQA